jgi:hypothetical protein
MGFIHFKLSPILKRYQLLPEQILGIRVIQENSFFGIKSDVLSGTTYGQKIVFHF